MNQQTTLFKSLDNIPAFVLIHNAAGPIQNLSEPRHGISKRTPNEYTYPE
jgi:hypothetical protein